MNLTHHQFVVSIIIAIFLFVLIVRLVQKGMLDIAYCWLWLGIGVGIVLAVARYDWLLALSRLIGAKTPTTTLFLLGFVVILLMCLQFSLVISTQRRQIKRLTQQLAILKSPSESTSPTSRDAACKSTAPHD